MTCLAGVCLHAPTRDASLGGEGEDADGNSIGIDKESPPVVTCWSDPDRIDEEPALVRISGEVEPFGTGNDRGIPGMCVTIYDAEALVAHWRDDSRCPDVADPQARARCFSTDPCECAAKLGPERTKCDADVGPYLGYSLLTERNGRYAIDGIPSNRPLLIKASGEEQLWRDTYVWSSGARTDRLQDDEGQSAFRVDPVVLSQTDWVVLPTLLNMAGKPEETKGAVAGELLDCGAPGRDPEPIIGATFGLVADAGFAAYHNGDPEADIGLDANLTHTQSLGIFGALDVPAGPNRFVMGVEIAGSTRVAAMADIYVPPGAAIVLLLNGRAQWREGP